MKLCTRKFIASTPKDSRASKCLDNGGKKISEEHRRISNLQGEKQSSLPRYRNTGFGIFPPFLGGGKGQDLPKDLMLLS